MCTIYTAILVYLLAINIIALTMYIYDKYKAKKKFWRTPEFYLILVAYIGGLIGAAMGMYVFRHKTNHLKFRILIPLAFIIYIGVFLLLIYLKQHGYILNN